MAAKNYKEGYKDGYAKAVDELKKEFRAEFEGMMAIGMEDCINWADWLDATADECMKRGGE